MGDAIDRTATQVRVPGNLTVHRLRRATTTAGGRGYRTRCGLTIAARADGAVLTTRAVDCRECQRDMRADEAAEVIP